MECDIHYEVIYSDGRNRITIDNNTITSITWGRALDDISKATITHGITDVDCCGNFEQLEPFRLNVIIKRNGLVVWTGVALVVEYSRSAVVVEAEDVLTWLKVRIPHDSYLETVDQAEHFENFWNLAMSPDDPGVSIVTIPTGVVQQREYDVDRRRITWNIIREMLDNGLDVTAIGNTIYAGVLSGLTSMLYLNTSDINGDITIRKDGNLYANKIYFNASGDVSGVYPEGEANAPDSYPLVEEVLSDSELKDAAGAQSSAKARWDFSTIVPRIVQASDSLNLNENSNIDINQLIPAKLITLDTSDLCLSQSQTYRLGKVDVVVSGNTEQVNISMQPYGTLEELQDFQRLETDSTE